jgi:hypothetical protein
MENTQAPSPSLIVSILAATVVGVSVGLAMFGPPRILAAIAMGAVAAVVAGLIVAAGPRRAILAPFVGQPVRFFHAAAWCGGLVGGIVVGQALA